MLILTFLFMALCNENSGCNGRKALVCESGENRPLPLVAKICQYAKYYDWTDELRNVLIFAQPILCQEMKETRKMKPKGEGNGPPSSLRLSVISLDPVRRRGEPHAAHVRLTCYWFLSCRLGGALVLWAVHMYPWSCPSMPPPHHSCLPYTSRARFLAFSTRYSQFVSLTDAYLLSQF